MNTNVLIELGRRFFGRDVQPASEQVAQLIQADTDLPAFAARAIEHAQAIERHSDPEDDPRVLITVAGRTWFDGTAEPAKELQAAFPTLTPSQAEVGARFLRQVLRARRKAQSRSRSNWVTESCRDSWG